MPTNINKKENPTQQLPDLNTDTIESQAAQSRVEVEAAPEKESEPQKKEQATESTESSAKVKKRLPVLQKKSSTIPQVRDELTLKIEKILEEGLDESFQRLSPIAKQEFKVKGEQTAIKIRDLMKSTRVKVKKILKLILEWLRILPGVNRFFLEQEAKIKADKIIALKNKQ